jgi:hypothetical protein
VLLDVHWQLATRPQKREESRRRRRRNAGDSLNRGQHRCAGTLSRSEEFAEAAIAVGLALTLGEVLSREGVHAESAQEVFGQPLPSKCLDHTPHNWSATSATTSSTNLGVVVELAVGAPSVIVVGLPGKRTTTVRAHKALRVPLLSARVYCVSLDGLVTAGASRGENPIEAALAERIPFPFEVGGGPKGLEALGADEAVDVPLLVEGADALALNGLAAVCAPRAELGLVAPPAGGIAVRLIEGARA